MRQKNKFYYNYSQLMKNLSYLLTFICFTILFSLSSGQNITIAPAPPLNKTTLFTLNDSTADTRFIGSDRIQNLQLTETGSGNSTATTFKINFYNRSLSNNLQSINISKAGAWKTLVNSRSTLSCSLVFESTNSTYGLLKFSNQNNLQLVFNGTKDRFPTQMANLPSTSPNPVDTTKISVGQLCNIFSFDKVPYLFNPSNATNPWVAVNVPNPSLNQGGSPDFSFVVTNNTLYQFNITNNNFSSVGTLPAFQKYDVKNSQGQLIIIGSSSSSTDNNVTYTVNQTVIAGLIVPGANNLPTLKVISTDNLTGLSPQPSIPIKTSPQLTKLSFFFKPPNSTVPQIVVKSIDYKKQLFSALTFQNSAEFMDTLKNAGRDELNLGDNFLLISNISGLIDDNTLGVVKQYYQYLAQKIISIRKTVIPNNQTTGLNEFIKAMIDPNIPNNLVVIQVIDKPTGNQYVQLQLGSLAANNRVVPPQAPPLVNFTVPTGVDIPSDKFLSWTYLDNTVNSSSSTKVTTFTFNHTAANKVQSSNFTLTGNWAILTQNPQCKLMRQVGAQNYTIMIFDKMTRQFRAFADVSALLTNVTTTNATKYGISLLCDRFSVDNRIYAIVPSNNTALQNFNIVSNNLTSFTWTSSDDNLTTVIVGSSVWRFQVASSNFTKILDSPMPLFSNAKLYSSPGRFVIAGANTTAAQVFAFADQNNGSIPCVFNWTFQNYTNTPMISVSVNSSKIMITGPSIPPNSAQAAPKNDIFFVNYMNKTAINITTPPNLLLDPLNTYLHLSDQFLYARQLAAIGNTTSKQEFIFFFDQDRYLKQAIVTNISLGAGYTWKKTVIFNTPDNQYLVLEELQQAVNPNTLVIVKSRQVSSTQSKLNNNNGGLQISGYTGTDGKLSLCSPGCSDCSSGTCTTCFPGSVMNQISFVCDRCGPHCQTCSSANPQTCYTCFPRAFLSGTICQPCDNSCMACSGTSTNCTTCPPGQSMAGGQIIKCPRFCFNCSDRNTCTTCNRGFVLTPNNTCRSCIMSCSSCNVSNITQCTSCADGLQLVDGACVSCPNNCKLCNNDICSTCFPGFQPNDAGVCVLQCFVPCQTCKDNQPSVCLSCYSGAIYSNATNSCSLDLTCSNSSTCSDCGLGLNYILVSGSCMACPTIENCIQCSSSQTQLCTLCSRGYYVNSTGGCTACSTNCTACISDNICSSCANGYTLQQDQSNGGCIVCTSPCVTCVGAATSCSSCIDGFTKKGWKCLNNTYVGFKIVFSADPSSVFTNIDSVISDLLTVGQKNNGSFSQDSLTFTGLKQGSTISQGAATGTDLSAWNLAAGQTIGGLTITSVEFTQYGATTTTPTITTTDSGKNLGLIIGLSVGIPVAIILIVVISCVIYRKKKQAQLVGPQNEVHGTKINESELVTAKEQGFNMNPGKVGSQQNWDKEITGQP